MACSKCLLLALIASLYMVSFMQGGAGVASESAVSWQAYWDEKLPRVQAPASLAGLSSRMSAEEAAGIRQGSVHTSLCHPQGMLCGQKASTGSGPIVCVAPYFYEYGTAKCKATVDMTTQAGLFFRPDELTAGTTLLYPALVNDLQGRTFLPAQLAAVMPFNGDKLASYMALLEVPRGSSMAANMQNTLAFCNSKPADGEVRTCHSSIESMVDFAVAHLGSNVAAMSLDDSPSKSEKVRVIRHVTLSPAHSASITCHDLMFPYLVYGCHVMQSSIVYDVELQRVNGSTFHGISICHVDTRSWNSAHPAFATLHAQPGDGTICHWLPQNNFLWVQT